MPYADFCSAVRPPLGRLSRRSDTEQISWGKLSHFPCTIAESTLRTLMDYGTSRYVAHSSRTGAFYSVFVHRLARLFRASFGPRLAAMALALSLGLHLHQVGQRTFTSKLLSMPSTQRSRWRGGRFACTGLIRRWSLEGLAVVRYDGANMDSDVSSISMSINNWLLTQLLSIQQLPTQSRFKSRSSPRPPQTPAASF